MKRKYIPVQDFCYFYDVSESNIYARRSKNDFDEDVFLYAYGVLYIDENYFVRRREFNLKIKHLAHKNYYALKYDLVDGEYIEKRFDIDICKLLKENTAYSDRSLQSWRQFISKDFFSVNIKGIMSISITPMVFEFYRVSEKILKQERRDKELEVKELGEPVVSDFRSVEEYYDYFEAKRILEEEEVAA